MYMYTVVIEFINVVGLWNQMSLRNKDVDVKLQRIQNLLSKTACPLICLMDMFVKKSSKHEGMTKNELQEYAVTCRDAYQLFQTVFSEVTFRRRAFIRSDINPQYKSLCDDDTEVTDKLFGDDLKEKIKDLDAENSVCKKVGKESGRKNRETGRTGRKHFGSRYRGGRRNGGKSFKRKRGGFVDKDNYSQKRPRLDDDFLEKGFAKKKTKDKSRLM